MNEEGQGMDKGEGYDTKNDGALQTDEQIIDKELKKLKKGKRKRKRQQPGEEAVNESNIV